jgi:coenzyme F420-reducing hydrogenase delta subunit
VHALRAQLESALAQLAQLAQQPATVTHSTIDDTAPPSAAGTDAREVVPRIVAFGCRPEHGGPDLAALADEHTATVTLLCAAQLPPSFVEFALRAGADGVLVTGCRDGECTFRLGNRWTDERLAGVRAPRLRAAVPRGRVRVAWNGRGGHAQLAAELASFRSDLAASMRVERAAFAAPPKRSQAPRGRAPVA